MSLRNPIDAVPGLEHPFVQLLLCGVVDTIGMVTYLVPGIGEFGDLLWAPIQTAFIATMIAREPYSVVFCGLSFFEELAPFTDFIPSAGLAWCWKYFRRWRK